MNADNLPNATDQELLEFFWSEPIWNDTIVAYVVADARGVKLRFSLDSVEASIQTVLSLNGEVLELVSHEQLTRFRIYGDRLLAECEKADERTELELIVRPQIVVRWSSLRTR